MLISDLPSCLLEEILCRVPATSLKRLRSTCKLWNTLFKDQRFTEKHFDKAPKESSVLMLTDYKVFPMAVNRNLVSIELHGSLSLIKDSHLTQVCAVFHCDGLLLCITGNKRPVVWNPCLGETKWIESKTGYNRTSRFALGYEKNKSGHSYKILMWSDPHDYMTTPHDRVDKFKIYELSSDSWRVLDIVSIEGSILSDVGVCLKGNTYWLAYDEKDKSQFLLSFDFTTERFKRLSLPQDHDHKIALSVVGEEQLSMISGIDYTSKIQIWITNKINTDTDQAVLKWTKCFTLNIPFNSDYSPVLATYLIDEEKKVIMSCNDCSINFLMNTSTNFYIIGEDNEFYREIPYAECTHTSKWCYPMIFNYIPSLVQVNIAKESNE